MGILTILRRAWRTRQSSAHEKSIIVDCFDAPYYLTLYPDVAVSNIDPVEHFLNYGWREGRNPNSWFITSFYLAQNPDVRDAGVNPFVHYVEYGRQEGRMPAPRRLDRPAPLATLLGWPVRMPPPTPTDLSVIVPVYNALHELQALLLNLEDTVGERAQVVLVDDCSPDDRISRVLAEFSGRHERWDILRNERNLGFAASVNRGIEHTTGHVILLNSDVLLPQSWLDRLVAPILEHEESIASVTPFSNNSSLTGFPQSRQETALPSDRSLDDVANAFARLPSLAIDVISGVGFCMALNRRALDKIGLFDADTYHGGYFEDTDWCQRAVLAGFRNVAVANLFVYHKVGSSSYGLEARNRGSENSRRHFRKKFPFYDNHERAFLSNDPLSETRMLAQAILWQRSARASVLFVDHMWGGGANVFSDRLRRRLLGEGNFVASLSLAQSVVDVRFSFQSDELKCEEPFSADIWRLADLLEFDEIIVNGVHGAGHIVETLAALVRLSKGSKLIFYVHDYMCVCPSIFLLDNDAAYCGVPELHACYTCLFANPHAKFAIVNQTEWRRAWGEFLAHSHDVRVFSESSRDILGKAYPALAASSRISLVEPDYAPAFGACGTPVSVSDEALLRPDDRPKRDRLRVGIMGSLYVHKGSKLVAEWACHIQRHGLPIDIILFGQWQDGHVPKGVEQLGPYRVADIPKLVRRKAISVMLFPSVCPETFSYTLSEIFLMELPVVALRVGAQAERVGQYKWGTVVEDASPANICKALYEVDVLFRKSAGQRWR